jgi:hypothetical protein
MFPAGWVCVLWALWLATEAVITPLLSPQLTLDPLEYVRPVKVPEVEPAETARFPPPPPPAPPEIVIDSPFCDRVILGPPAK